MGNAWKERKREMKKRRVERREKPTAFLPKANFNRLLSGGLDYKLNLRRPASPLFIFSAFSIPYKMYTIAKDTLTKSSKS